MLEDFEALSMMLACHLEIEMYNTGTENTVTTD